MGRRDSPLLMILMAIGMVAVVAAFLASTFQIHWRLQGLNQAISLAENGAPSVSLLARAQDDLHALRDAANKLQSGTGDEHTRDDMQRARHQLGTDLAAELETPLFPGEAPVNRALLDDLPKLDAAIANLGKSGADQRAARLALLRLEQAAEDLGAQLAHLRELNAAALQADANTLLAKQRAGLSLALWVAAPSLVVATLVTLGLFRFFGRYTELEKQRRIEAEQRAHELDAFAARVAHDLMSPLATVSLALGAGDTPTDDRAGLLRARAIAAMARVRKIVDDLLSFARSGGKPPSDATSSVPDVVAGVLEEARPRAEVDGIELRCEAVPSCEVACEAGILTVILTNLLINAIKFMGDSAERRIDLRVRGLRDTVRFEVEDTGTGLPPHFEEVAFDPYRRAQANIPGLGLGLATVKRLVDAHRGRVGIESKPPPGARFWIELPRPLAPLAAPAPLPRPG